MQVVKASIALIAVFVIASCRTGLPVKTFSTQEEAGSVHVAVQSVALFDEEYIDQLQPQLDPNDVTSASAITLTRIRQLEQLRDLLIQANVALQSSTVTQNKVTKLGVVTDNTITEATTPPSLDKLPTAPTSTIALPSPLTLPSGVSPALDQALTFRAVAALKQEVALLNRFVRDAAVARGTRPVVVRVLVTLNPSAHFEPYNAFTAISLFSDKPETRLPPWEEALQQLPAEYLMNTRDLLERSGSELCGKPIEVVPLFVTDNLESSLDNLAAQKNLGISGSAAGIVQNTAASVGGNFRSQDLEQDQGHTVNSLYTVARLSSNTIEARLGAPVAGTSYEMIPRTYNVTVLALVPTARAYLDRHPDYTKGFSRELTTEVRDTAEEILPCHEIVFTSVARFVDARSGRTLTSNFAIDSDRELESLARNWNFHTTSAAMTTLRTMLAYAEYDSYDEFHDLAKEDLGRYDLKGRYDFRQSEGLVRRDDIKSGRADTERMLWLDLVSILRRSGRGYGRFTLPVSQFQFFPGASSGTVLDDGTAARLTLAGGRAMTASGMLARLEVEGCHTLQSTAVKVSADGRTVTIEFPSPKKLLNREPKSLQAVVQREPKRFESPIAQIWQHSTDDPDLKGGRLTYLLTPKADAPTPAVVMEVTAPHIVITDKDAGGTLAVAFRSTDPKKPKVRFSVSGAYIADTSPATSPDASDRVGPGSGVYVVSLRNLAAGGKVTVSAFLDDGGKRGASIDQKTVDVIDGVKNDSSDK